MLFPKKDLDKLTRATRLRPEFSTTSRWPADVSPSIHRHSITQCGEIARSHLNLPAGHLRGLPVTHWIIFWFVLLTLLGIWPALSNGQPFFFADTTAYVRGADLAISKALGSRFATDWARDQRRMIEPQAAAPNPEQPAAEQKFSRRVVLAGRSIIYGALLYLGEVLGGMWFSVVIQSLIASYLIFIFTVRALGLNFRYFLFSCVFLFIASPLPFFASCLMPDVFAGFLILGFTILATSWNRLNHAERAITSTVVLYAVLSHPTHLLLLIGLTAMTLSYVVLRARSHWINIRWLTAIAAACLVIALFWEVAFSFAVSWVFGVPPIRPPFVTAKLVSMLGEPAVAKVCASHAFVICRFQDRFPIDVESFLWSEDERTGIFNVADVRTKRLLSDEQMRFALAIIPGNLGHFAAGMFLDALWQLTHIGLDEYVYSPSESGLSFFRARLPSHHFDRLTSTFAARSDAYVVFGRTVLYFTAIIGAIVTAVLLGGMLRPGTVHSANELEKRKTWRAATYILLAGIILNAMICGDIATVNDRYQARVVWLIQFSLITGICVMRPHVKLVALSKRSSEENIPVLQG